MTGSVAAAVDLQVDLDVLRDLRAELNDVNLALALLTVKDGFGEAEYGSQKVASAAIHFMANWAEGRAKVITSLEHAVASLDAAIAAYSGAEGMLAQALSGGSAPVQA